MVPQAPRLQTGYELGRADGRQGSAARFGVARAEVRPERGSQRSEVTGRDPLREESIEEIKQIRVHGMLTRLRRGQWRQLAAVPFQLERLRPVPEADPLQERYVADAVGNEPAFLFGPGRGRVKTVTPPPTIFPATLCT